MTIETEVEQPNTTYPIDVVFKNNADNLMLITAYTKRLITWARTSGYVASKEITFTHQRFSMKAQCIVAFIDEAGDQTTINCKLIFPHENPKQWKLTIDTRQKYISTINNRRESIERIFSEALSDD